MKRALCILLTLLLLCGTVSVASATSDYDEHKHHWVNMGDDRDATCTEPGEAYEYCDICHETRTRVIPPKGHHFPPEDWEVTKQPTCTEPGQEMNHCTRVNFGRVCGYEWRRELPALGHDWSEWYVIKEPKPGEPGFEERKCGRCGITQQRPCYVDGDKPAVDVEIVKTVVSEPAGDFYAKDEVITFEITVTNNGDEAIYNVHVFERPGDTDETTYEVGSVAELDGHSSTPPFVVNYTVSEFDVNEGMYTNGAAVMWDDHPDEELYPYSHYLQADPVTVILREDISDIYQLILSAQLKNPQSSYSEGERAYFDVSITNNSDEEFCLNDSWYRTPSGDQICDWYILKLQPGETQSYEAFYDLLEKDIDLSTDDIRLEFQCNGWPTRLALGDEESPLVYSNIDVVLVPLGGEEEDIGDMELVVEKTIKGVSEDEEYPSYTEGDEITFVVSVGNCQAYPLYDVVISDEDSAGNSVILGSYEVFEGGAHVEYEYTHTVTLVDCEAGIYENTVIGTWYSNETDRDSGEDKNLIDDTVSVETWHEPSDMELCITKTEISAPLNGSYYTESETLICEIDVWNSQGYTLYNVTVDDRDKEGILPLYFGDFAPHQKMVFTVSHPIDSVDRQNGYYENTAYGRWTEEADPDSEIFEVSAGVTVSCAAPSGIGVEKHELSVPANGLYYVEGETVYYSVTITNNTRLYLHKLTLLDELLPEGTVFDELKEPLAPGESVTVNYSYTVTAQDVLIGSVFNVAIVNADGRVSKAAYSKIMQKLKGSSAEVTVPTGQSDDDETIRGVTLTKELVGIPENGLYYKVGEPINYRVTIENTLPYTVEKVHLTDPLLGSGDQCVLEADLDLTAGVIRVYTVTYIPTQADADCGVVSNWAECSYYDPMTEENGSVTSNTVVVAVDEKRPVSNVSLSKYVISVPGNGLYYEEGETIRYRLILTNESDRELYSVAVYDPLYDDGKGTTPVWQASVLSPYETAEAIFDYTVTHEDVENLTDIINQAHAEYYPDPDGEVRTAVSNTVITPIGKLIPPDPELPYIDMNVTKTAVNPPANGQWYMEGEQVVFMITFSNTGDVPLYLVDYIDEVINAASSYSFTVDLADQEVAPHTTVSFSYPYTVTKEDAEGGFVRNEVEFFAWTEIEPFGRLVFYPWSHVTVETGPGDPEILEYPVAYKFEVSTPANGICYTEDEQIEYDIVLYNATGRTFKNVESYDILLTDVPGYWLNYHESLGSAPITEHVAYIVKNSDVVFGDVYNIAWFTMVDEDGSIITVNSNEVIVETGDTLPPPSHGGKASCEYVLSAEGEGAATYKNDYCFEHASLQKRVNEMLLAADTPDDLERAWRKTAELWLKSLNALYTREIDASEGETKTALENDLSMLNAYLSAYRARLEAEGASSIEIDKALAAITRDFTCEMCYSFGHAPEARKDLSGLAAFEQQRQNALRCEVRFEANGSSFYTKHLNVCDSHVTIVKAQDRALQIAGEDAGLLAIARDRADALWQNALDGEFSQASDKADALLKHQLLKEQAAFNAFVRTRAQVYALLYPDDEAAVKELIAALKCQKLLDICR